MFELFKHLTHDDQQRLLAGARRLVFGRGDVIVAEGSANQALYLLRSGRLGVEREHLGQRMRIAHMHPGEHFGEMSLLDQSSVSATVVADETSEVDVVEGAAMGIGGSGWILAKSGK